MNESDAAARAAGRSAKRVVVHGHVQGVFFRDSIRILAQQRGVAGWVRNNPAGTVEALFEGSEEAVDDLIEFCREGPSGAAVERVDVSGAEDEGLTAFRIA